MTVSESFNPWFRNSWLYRDLRLNSCLFLEAARKEDGETEVLGERGTKREKRSQRRKGREREREGNWVREEERKRKRDMTVNAVRKRQNGEKREKKEDWREKSRGMQKDTLWLCLHYMLKWPKSDLFANRERVE